MKRHPALFFIFGSALVLVGLLAVLIRQSFDPTVRTDSVLIVHCATGIRAPLEAIAREYQAETGTPIELRFGPSQSLLSSIEVTQQGDVIVPADEVYTQLVQEKGLLNEVFPLAQMKAVLILAPQGKTIRTWKELIHPEIRIAQANPDAAAIGKITRDQLAPVGLWEGLAQRTTVFKGTVTDVVNAVKIGSVDAGIVWDAAAFLAPDCPQIELPELKSVRAKVQIGVLTTSTNPSAALQFARYVAAKDRGLIHFQQNGFPQIADGDSFESTRELIVYAGSMLRPAIEDTITEFEKRERVQVTRVYNGCGILVGQMKTGERPDLYIACDPQFMSQVQDLFETPEIVSSNQLVLAVKKGNPHQIRDLPDLGKPGLKVGVGHEQQCALGAITKETFLQTGVYAAVQKNITVQSPTGDLLINQLRAGSLDVVVAYRSNAILHQDIEAIPVTGIKCASPQQPMAMNKSTEKRQQAQRLMEAIRSQESKERFQKNGFGWERKE